MTKQEIKTLSLQTKLVGSCWIWTGRTNANGYATTSFHSRHWLVHRLLFVHVNGHIPEGKCLHHICHVKRCVNPEHVVPVTAKEHKALHKSKPRQQCRNGHSLSVNPIVVTRKNGTSYLQCRICSNEYHRQWSKGKPAPKRDKIKRREYIRCYMRGWRDKHREHYRTYMRERYQKYKRISKP